MKRRACLQGVLSIVCLLSFGLGPWFIYDAHAQDPKEAQKKVGFMGDPTQKRGIEIGYDRGLKAGREDKAAGREPSLKNQGDLNNPEKYHRWEFGSQARFVSGFRSGFVAGYKSAFSGQKIKLSASDLAQNNAGNATTVTQAQHRSKTKTVVASDAL